MVEFDQMREFFNIVSPVVYTLLPSVLHLDSHGIEALILKLKNVLNCRYDLIICPILIPSQVFFYVGEQKVVRSCQSGEYGGWSTSSKPQPCTAAIATTDLCAGALSWWNRTPFINFPGRLPMSIVLLFKVLNYLSIVGLSGRKQCS